MRKTLLFLTIIILTTGCGKTQKASGNIDNQNPSDSINKPKTTDSICGKNVFVGRWLEIESEDNGSLVLHEKEYSTYLIIEETNAELTIIKDYDGAHKSSICDNVLMNGKKLIFRTHNVDGSFNHSKLNYDEKSKKLLGQIRAWDGSILDVEYVKQE